MEPGIFRIHVVSDHIKSCGNRISYDPTYSIYCTGSLTHNFFPCQTRRIFSFFLKKRLYDDLANKYLEKEPREL